METSLIDSIKTKVAKISGQQVSAEQPLWTTGLLDSLGRMELAFYVADLTQVELEVEDVCRENFESVEHIIEFLKRKRGT